MGKGKGSAEMAELRIGMLGSFSLEIQDQKINLIDLLGKQTAQVLAYLCFNHDTVITKDRLISLFWEDSKNPLNALKFTIYRIRKGLETLPQAGMADRIITQKGGYLFSGKGLNLDIEQLDSARSDEPAEALRAVELYQGEFLESLDGGWIYSVRENSWQTLIHLIQKTAEVLTDQNQIEDAEALLMRGLKFDPYQDQLNYQYLKLLLDEKKYARAIKHYEKISSSFYKEFGMEFQGKTQSLIYFVSASQSEKNISPKEYLENLDINQGQRAFYCERAVFQKLVQNKVLESKRTQDVFLLVMMNLKINDPALDRNQCGDQLNQIIRGSLRASDVFTRFSETQFGLLLTVRETEDVHTIAERLIRKFNKKIPAMACRVHYEYEILDAQKIPD